MRSRETGERKRLISWIDLGDFGTLELLVYDKQEIDLIFRKSDNFSYWHFKQYYDLLAWIEHN